MALKSDESGASFFFNYKMGSKENTYCFAQDARKSGQREGSPQQRLYDWVTDPSTKEILLAAMTFSHCSLWSF